MSTPSSLRWALVSAPKGKLSQLTGAVVRALAQRGVNVAGFLQERDETAQYLVRASTGERVVVTRPESTPREGEESFCSVVVRPAAFELARAWLEADGERARAWILDGLSRLEASGKGHVEAVRWAFAHAGARPVVLGVRADQLFDVMRVLELEHEPIASLESEPGDDAAIDSFVAALNVGE